MEKLSNCQDSQESTRSDEEGSSNSDNDNNEIVGDDAKDETASSSGKSNKDKVEKYKNSKDDSPDVDRTDEDSDNPERNEEIISLAAELLDRWRLLKVQYCWFIVLISFKRFVCFPPSSMFPGKLLSPASLSCLKYLLVRLITQVPLFANSIGRLKQ